MTRSRNTINLFIVFTLLLLLASPSFSQQLSGRWCSSDSSRIYVVKNTDDGLEAVLISSAHKEDATGWLIMYAKKKKRGVYAGMITSPDRELTTSVKVRMTKNNELLLKLRRMFIFTIRIKWYRAGDKS
jgi:hypothetical protein